MCACLSGCSLPPHRSFNEPLYLPGADSLPHCFPYSMTHTSVSLQEYTSVAHNCVFQVLTHALNVSQFREKQEVVKELQGCWVLWVRGCIQLFISICRTYAPPCSLPCMFPPRLSWHNPYICPCTCAYTVEIQQWFGVYIKDGLGDWEWQRE